MASRKTSRGSGGNGTGGGGGAEVELKRLCATIRTTRSTLARAEDAARAKVLYEELHPETRQGGAAGKSGGGKRKNSIPAYVTYLARETGWSPSTITGDIRIATQLVEAAKSSIQDTVLANKTRDLLALADLAEEHQMQAVNAFRTEGMKAMRAVIAEVAPRPKNASGAPLSYEIEITPGKLQTIKELRISVELVSVSDGTAKVRLSRSLRGTAEDQQRAPEPPIITPPVEQPIAEPPIKAPADPPAETPPEATTIEPKRSLTALAAVDLYSLPGRALTQEEVGGLAGAIQDEDALPTLRAEAVDLPDGMSPDASVYGDMEKAVSTLMGKRGSKLDKAGAAAGLLPFDDEPGSVVYVAYGDRMNGTLLLAVGRVATDASLHGEFHATMISKKGKAFVVRFSPSMEALGEALNCWSAPRS